MTPGTRTAREQTEQGSRRNDARLGRTRRTRRKVIARPCQRSWQVRVTAARRLIRTLAPFSLERTPTLNVPCGPYARSASTGPWHSGGATWKRSSASTSATTTSSALIAASASTCRPVGPPQTNRRARGASVRRAGRAHPRVPTGRCIASTPLPRRTPRPRADRCRPRSGARQADMLSNVCPAPVGRGWCRTHTPAGQPVHATIGLPLRRRRSSFGALHLRHELAVLRRQVARPALLPADRAVLAGLSRALSAARCTIAERLLTPAR